MVQGDVPRDPEQPRRGGTAAGIEAGRVPPGPDEGVLGDLLGGLTLTGDREGQSEHPGLEAADEHGGDVWVTNGHPGHERFVGDVPHL